MVDSIDDELQSKTRDSFSTLMTTEKLSSTEDPLSTFSTVDHYGPGDYKASEVTVGKDEVTMRIC